MTRIRLIFRKTARYARLTPVRKILLIEAALWLALARLALVFLPFRWIAGHLGTVTVPANATAQSAASMSPEAAVLAATVGWAVRCAARNVPFKAVCLPQALAAKAMLARRNTTSVLHFGVAKGLDKPLEAHAWLDAAGVEVTGYPLIARFTEVARFV